MMRNTIQRNIVLQTIQRLKSHPTADEVYDEIKTMYPNISRATVYRNLNVLSSLGEIRKLEIPGGPDRFDHWCENHCHVRCEKCGKLFDVDMNFIDGLDKKIKDNHGFTFNGYQIIFKGICPSCQKK
ncbi:MAG: transcriptional repressor [Erysipelotrichaceae bacterium]|nr:transcriptional repressor [Erysipelotrichaceae bacterium]